MVIHLAAQAGVRYSLENPRAYIDANVVGTFNVLELARAAAAAHFLIASTSSVYGANTKMPFAETDRTDQPLTLYAATKKATEAMAHCYAICGTSRRRCSGSSRSTGPGAAPTWRCSSSSRPCSTAARSTSTITGEMDRDFTYIDDLVESIILLIDAVPIKPILPDMTDEDLGLSPAAPYRVVNIGNGQPVRLLTFIEAIEKASASLRNETICPCSRATYRLPTLTQRCLSALPGFARALP